ncbi:14267_t:CDS:1, partial [Dentiscutata heterogama]
MEISIEQPLEKVESTTMKFTLIHANDRTDDCKNITSTELTSMKVTYTQTNKPEDVNNPEMEIGYLNIPRKRNFIKKDSDSTLAENEQDVVKLVLLYNECGVIDYGLASQIEKI